VSEKEISNVTDESFVVGDVAKGVLFQKSWRERGASLIT